MVNFDFEMHEQVKLNPESEEFSEALAEEMAIQHESEMIRFQDYWSQYDN